jgi:hypothetical protein
MSIVRKVGDWVRRAAAATLARSPHRVTAPQPPGRQTLIDGIQISAPRSQIYRPSVVDRHAPWLAQGRPLAAGTLTLMSSGIE